MKLLILLVSLSLLFSCSTERKAQRKVAWLIAHDKLDDYCARVYPVRDSLVIRDSLVVDTVFLGVEPTTIYDTVYKRGDTTVKVITKKCPPHKVITNTVYRDTSRYITNTAEVERLKGVILEKDKAVLKAQEMAAVWSQKAERNDKWKWLFFGLATLNLLAVVFRLFILKRPL